MGQFALFADWFSLHERRNDWLLVGWEHVAVMDKRCERAFLLKSEKETCVGASPEAATEFSGFACFRDLFLASRGCSKGCDIRPPRWKEIRCASFDSTIISC